MNASGDDPNARRTPAPGSIREEEACAARLAARRQAALARLNAARAALRADPGNALRAAEVMQRVYALRDLQARCELQQARLAAARAAAGLEPFASSAGAERLRAAPHGRAGPGAARPRVSPGARPPQGARQR